MNVRYVERIIFGLMTLSFIKIAMLHGQPAPANFKLFCYLEASSLETNDSHAFHFRNLDPFLCTHFAYSFATLKDNKIASSNPGFDLEENGGKGGFKRFTDMKSKNPNLKLLISIGGYGEPPEKFSSMAENERTRQEFVKSVLQFLQQYHFDGLDVDWEYPTRRGGLPEDRRNFFLLLKELKTVLEPRGLLLTAALASKQYDIDPGFQIPKINQYLDFLNIMAYDFHEGLGTHTGNNAALFKRQNESDVAKKLNADFSVQYWIQQGASRNKILLGMPTYGRTQKLEDANEHYLGAPATGRGPAGPLTKMKGLLAYKEICQEVKPENGWTTVFDNTQMVPYAYKGSTWLSFDNQKSLRLKANYIRKMGLAGGMIYALDTDDFAGWCGGGTYPLVKTVKSGLGVV